MFDMYHTSDLKHLVVTFSQELSFISVGYV